MKKVINLNENVYPLTTYLNDEGIFKKFVQSRITLSR